LGFTVRLHLESGTRWSPWPSPLRLYHPWSNI